MFFNEDGILNLDEMVINNESFKNIMEDGINPTRFWHCFMTLKQSMIQNNWKRSRICL